MDDDVSVQQCQSVVTDATFEFTGRELLVIHFQREPATALLWSLCCRRCKFVLVSLELILALRFCCTT